MASSKLMLEVEAWIRCNWLLKHYGQKFDKVKVPLSSGGVFEFDAVSGDRKIVASISTSQATTASGRPGVGKLMKIRSDLYFLLLVDAKRRLMVFSEPDMLELCRKEQEVGRVPSFIEFVHAHIPDDLATRLTSAREVASKEVTPLSAREAVRRHSIKDLRRSLGKVDLGLTPEELVRLREVG